MSKLSEKLQRLGRGVSQPMGFGAALAKAKPPAMVIIAQLDASGLAWANSGASGGADAFLIRLEDPGKLANLEKAGKLPTNIPCGVSVNMRDGGYETPQQLNGIDFVVFGYRDTPAAILSQHHLGKVLEVDYGISEGLIRPSERLPIDAVLVRREVARLLTIQDLLLYQRVGELVGKPLLGEIALPCTADELQGLRDVGVKGVLVSLAQAKDDEQLRSLRTLVDSLPAGRKRPERREALVPRVSTVETPVDGEEEEEGDGEEEP